MDFNKKINNEVLVKVEGVSKKFSKDLKRSLLYGLNDIGNEIIGREGTNRTKLRKTEFWAVKDVSFELRRGECLGLIGRNGAGKTTLLKILNGLVKPDEGRVEMRGLVGALIALGTGFNPILTGRENIFVNASILGLKQADIKNKVEEIIEFAELGDFIEAPVRSYSSGMVSRLGFAIAVHMNPDILILDEVLAVGDAGFKMKSLNKMYEIMNDTAVIFVNHNMATLSRVCNKVMYLKNGEVQYVGEDVLGGIEKYLSQYEDEKSYIDYNTKAQFNEINISSNPPRGTDAKGRPIINHGDDLIIDFHYHLNPQYDVHSIGFVISNKDFLTVAAHRTQAIRNNPDGNMQVQVKIPQIELSNGEYSVTFKVSNVPNDDEMSENYATYRHWRKFKVEGLKELSSVPFHIFGEIVHVNNVLENRPTIPKS
jgi:lipopolysaccharide transport system ATP-binding protein